jgi:hypothetical protein
LFLLRALYICKNFKDLLSLNDQAMKKLLLISALFTLTFYLLPFTSGAQTKAKITSITYNNKVLQANLLDDWKDFSENLCPMEYKGKWGFIDNTNKVTIDFRFKSTGSFSDGFCNVVTDSGNAYINKHGKITIRCYKYSVITPFYNRMASLKDSLYFILIDTTDKRINNTLYLNIGNWDTYGHLMVMDTAKHVRWLNKQGVIVGDTMDKSVFALFTKYNSVEGNYNFSKDNTWFGNVTLENDMLPITQWGDEYGYINMKTKKIVIPYQYSGADLFHGGLAAVLEDEVDKWGFIDKTNKLIIDFQFNLIHPDGFKDSIKSKVKNDYYEDWWWIDKTGKKLNLPREKN